MARSRRDTIACVSDTHLGSSTALCPAVVELDDGGTYRASKAQRWLWQSWESYWAQVQAVKPQGGGRRWCIHLGDVVEGDHHDTSAVISRNPVTMLRLASGILEPVRHWADYLFILRGTEAHGGEAGSWDEILADDLGAERDTTTDRASWWHLLLDVGGVLFDCAHTPPSAPGRIWTRANAATVLAFTTFAEYAQYGERPPDVALRGHIHKFTDSGGNYPTRAITCPAWQLATPYTSRHWPGTLAHIGGLVFTVQDGQSHLQHVWFRPERNQPWRESANPTFTPS